MAVQPDPCKERGIERNARLRGNGNATQTCRLGVPSVRSLRGRYLKAGTWAAKGLSRFLLDGLKLWKMEACWKGWGRLCILLYEPQSFIRKRHSSASLKLRHGKACTMFHELSNIVALQDGGATVRLSFLRILYLKHKNAVSWCQLLHRLHCNHYWYHLLFVHAHLLLHSITASHSRAPGVPREHEKLKSDL